MGYGVKFFICLQVDNFAEKLHELAQRIRVGAVNYLNTKPLLYGFEQGMMKDEIDLEIGNPAEIAEKLLNDGIDIGLVPVAILPSLKDHYIVSEFCIGSIGEVGSVCLFSDVPMEEIKTVISDYQSRTSIALLRILMKEYWKKDIPLKASYRGYEKDIGGETAGLVIGDRALAQKKLSVHSFDLGEAWYKMTGLPFVFAAWVSNREMSREFMAKFDAANAYGLAHLPEVLAWINKDEIDLHHYYTQNLSYLLDERKREGMRLFLEKLGG